MGPFDDGNGMPSGIMDLTGPIMDAIKERMFGVSQLTLENAEEIYAPLEKLCQGITSARGELEAIREELNTTFSEFDEIMPAITMGGSVDFLASFYHVVAAFNSEVIGEYLALASQFEKQLGNGKFTEAIRSHRSYQSRAFSETIYNVQDIEIVTQRLASLVNDANSLFGGTKARGLEGLQTAVDGIASYNKYLQERFTKPDDDGAQEDTRKVIMLQEQGERRADFVKVRLFEDSPLLTDALLSLVDRLPQYQMRKVKGKKKKIPGVSEYAVRGASQRIAAFSDPQLMSYLEEPKEFFSRIGDALKRFYAIAETFEAASGELLVSQSNGAMERKLIDEKLRKFNRTQTRLVEDICSADFDTVVQNEDDISPDNVRERQHFRKREEIFTLFYEAMQELSTTYGKEESSHETLEKRREMAKETVLEAVSLKSQIDRIMQSAQARRLREDRNRGNEFYIGQQGHIGKFHFQREPAPSIKVSEIRGASFDEAKGYMETAIQTADFNRIMRLTAPAGRYRSNILLLGPPGCGKTELFRGYAGDKRTIGAEVNVAKILTAWAHESVANVLRAFERSKELYQGGQETKPVVLGFDEFEGFFPEKGKASMHDMEQIETVLLQTLDGVRDFGGIISFALSNKPEQIPQRIMRRFDYVSVVGELTDSERAGLMQMFFERGMVTSPEMQDHYLGWAKKLRDAPGDVIRKVADKVHMEVVPTYLLDNPSKARFVEGVVRRREQRGAADTEKDRVYVKRKLREGGVIITPDYVDKALDHVLSNPAIYREIQEARNTYKAAHKILERMASSQGNGQDIFDEMKQVGSRAHYRKN